MWWVTHPEVGSSTELVRDWGSSAPQRPCRGVSGESIEHERLHGELPGQLSGFRWPQWPRLGNLHQNQWLHVTSRVWKHSYTWPWNGVVFKDSERRLPVWTGTFVPRELAVTLPHVSNKLTNEDINVGLERGPTTKIRQPINRKHVCQLMKCSWALECWQGVCVGKCFLLQGIHL